MKNWILLIVAMMTLTCFTACDPQEAASSAMLTQSQKEELAFRQLGITDESVKQIVRESYEQVGEQLKAYDVRPELNTAVEVMDTASGLVPAPFGGILKIVGGVLGAGATALAGWQTRKAHREHLARIKSDHALDGLTEAINQIEDETPARIQIKKMIRQKVGLHGSAEHLDEFLTAHRK